MSRQYPSSQDIEYLIGWAERKVIHMMQKARADKFVNIAEFTRLVAVYLNAGIGFDGSQNWLRRRISDTYYDLSKMQFHEESSEKFNQAEDNLIETLKYISEYYEENGGIDFSSYDSAQINISKVWRTPSRWLKENSEDFDSLE